MKFYLALAFTALTLLGCNRTAPPDPVAPPATASTAVSADTAQLADALGVRLDEATQTTLEDDNTAIPLDSECCREFGEFVCPDNGREYSFRMCNAASQNSARSRCDAACNATCRVHYPQC